MDTASRLLPWIPFIPAASALVLTLFGRAIGQARVGKLASGAVGVCFLLAAVVFVGVSGEPAGERAVTMALFDWIALDAFHVSAALRLDPLSSIMILVVTGVGWLVHVYSLVYPGEERDAHRYFAYLNLLTGFMLLLVLGENLLLMFVGWEGAGVCSYLLIGYRSETKAAADAAMKAFVVNRLGDLALLLGILMTAVVFGTLRFQELLPLAPTRDTTAVTAIAVLLFVGAIGTSAQIPLHVWLPDAVQAPAPVSAFLQGVTMAVAGIYLLARTAPLFAEAPLALGLVAAVGAVSAVFAAAAALQQDDLQRALAYSTVSQLGYMFLACGLGAFGAAVFHLVTHAVAKALLFLCAANVLQAAAGRGDIRRMGGLKKGLPLTYVTFAIATLALVGVPPFSGFFSINEILWSAFRGELFFLWGAGLAGMFLTALYMGRLWMLIFEGRRKGDREADHSVQSVQPVLPTQPASESRGSTAWPLRLLAAAAAAIGFVGIPHYSAIESYLAPYLAIASHQAVRWTTEGSARLASVVVALAGLWLAGRVFSESALGRARRGEEKTARLGSGHGWPGGEYGLDSLYDRALLRPLDRVSRFVLWRGVERGVVDGGFHASARLFRVGGESLRLVHNGNLRLYLFVLFAGAVAVLAWILLEARWAS